MEAVDPVKGTVSPLEGDHGKRSSVRKYFDILYITPAGALCGCDLGASCQMTLSLMHYQAASRLLRTRISNQKMYRDSSRAM